MEKTTTTRKSIDFVFVGAIIHGCLPDKFRIIAQLHGISNVSEPFWADAKFKSVYRGRISSMTDKLIIRFAVEPNSDVFTLGGSIHEIEVDLFSEHAMAISAPIRLRTTESLITYDQNISIQFEFAWHLY